MCATVRQRCGFKEADYELHTEYLCVAIDASCVTVLAACVPQVAMWVLGVLLSAQLFTIFGAYLHPIFLVGALSHSHTTPPMKDTCLSPTALVMWFADYQHPPNCLRSHLLGVQDMAVQ